MCDDNVDYSLKLYTPRNGSLYRIGSSVQNDTAPSISKGMNKKS